MGDMADDYNYEKHHSFRANGIDQPKKVMTPSKENNPEERIDEILDSVYGAGLLSGEKYSEGRGANTIASDVLWKSKKSLLQLIQEEKKKTSISDDAELSSLLKIVPKLEQKAYKK